MLMPLCWAIAITAFRSRRCDRDQPGGAIAAGSNEFTARVSGNEALKVNLAWKDNATTETGYTVQRRSGQRVHELSTSIVLLPTNSVKFNDRGVQQTTTYRYRVYAESNAGPSDFSNIADVTTQ